MIVSHLELVNWKNFHRCSVSLTERCFVVGANASGKSNFLDLFRFLRDIVKAGGGLQTAVATRGGMKKIRCLAARSRTDVSIDVTLKESAESPDLWRYVLAFKHTGGGIVKNEVMIVKEEVYKEGVRILSRGEKSENEDTETLKFTHLEQAITNAKFRELKNFFLNIDYLNVVPQLVRETGSTYLTTGKEDYYGRNFIAHLAQIPPKTSASYLRKVSEVLRLAVPQFKDLTLVKDEMGVPHLEVIYEHWRSRGSKQREEQFSDGTLRLIGFLFALLDSKGLVLLEEPETNLHSAIVSQFPEYIARMQRSKKEARQVFVTTHSYEMLSNQGIGGDEVILLKPSPEGTQVSNVTDLNDVQMLLSAGLSVADAVIPYTAPQSVSEINSL